MSSDPTTRPESTDGSVDPRDFRTVLGQFSTGVTVITAMLDGVPIGFSANSFTSVSLDPPLVLFCAGRASETWPAIRAAGAFAVNVLAADQLDVAAGFARKGGDRFAGVAWEPGPATGSPLLPDSLAWIDCRIDTIYDGGDHELVIGRVLAVSLGRAATEGDEPLVFYGGGYHTVGGLGPDPAA